MCAKRKELKAEEKAKSYSKYYYMDMTVPDQTLINQVKKGPIDPKDTLRHKNVNDIFQPGIISKLKVGYCNFPDGSAYAHVCTKMPGVTVEMLDWWLVWHPLDPLRYKIWDPEDHMDVRISDENRKRLTDPGIPLHERNWGCTHFVREDFGLPVTMKLFLKLIGKDVENVVINFVHPEKLGIDMSKLTNPKEVSISGAISDAGTTMSVLKRVDGGMELHGFYWISPKLKAPPILMQCLVLHNIKEYTHLAKILPSVYAEEKENW